VSANAAYYVNPLKIEEIAEGMKRILQSADLANYFISRGKERAGYFSYQKAAAEFLSCLK
jgi:hypothetical protein